MPNEKRNELEDHANTAHQSYQFKGNETGSDDEIVTMRHSQEQRQRPVPMSTISSKAAYTRHDGSIFVKPPKPQPMISSKESVDGDDAFENTKNKKKRKIPMSGSLGNHQSTLSAEMAQMGLSGNRDIDASHIEADNGVGHYYGSGSSAVPAVSSGNGISGAGRGRYGRAGTRHYTGRSPLGVSVNGSNSLQAGRSLYQRRDNASISTAGLKGDDLCKTCGILKSSD